MVARRLQLTPGVSVTPEDGVLLEAVERREVNPPTSAPGTERQERSVTSTTIQANNARCHAGTCLSPRGVPVEMASEVHSVARRRGEARFWVHANICVQRSAGRVPAIAVSAELAGRR